MITRRVGETSTLYGSVTSADIAEFYESRQLSVDKRKIQLKEPIKELGDFSIAIRLHPDVVAEVTVKVLKEETDTAAAETPTTSA